MTMQDVLKRYEIRKRTDGWYEIHYRRGGMVAALTGSAASGMTHCTVPTLEAIIVALCELASSGSLDAYLDKPKPKLPEGWTTRPSGGGVWKIYSNDNANKVAVLYFESPPTIHTLEQGNIEVLRELQSHLDEHGSLESYL
jgi:hypothetical protein